MTKYRMSDDTIVDTEKARDSLSYLSGDFEEFVTHASLQLNGVLVGLNRIFVSQDNYGKIEGQTAYVMEEYGQGVLLYATGGGYYVISSS